MRAGQITRKLRTLPASNPGRAKCLIPMGHCACLKASVQDYVLLGNLRGGEPWHGHRETPRLLARIADCVNKCRALTLAQPHIATRVAAYFAESGNIGAHHPATGHQGLDNRETESFEQRWREQ